MGLEQEIGGASLRFAHIIVLSQYPKLPNGSNALWVKEYVDFLQQNSHPFFELAFVELRACSIHRSYPNSRVTKDNT